MIFKRILEAVQENGRTLGLVLNKLNAQEKTMSAGIDELKQSVTTLTTLVQTVITILQNADPDATVKSLADEINTQIAALQAAIPPAS